MFLPQESLSDVALIALIFAMIARLLLVLPSCVAIIQMFGSEVREGVRLFKSLAIPGLNAFVVQELVLAIVPFFALGTVILSSDSELLL